MIGARRGGSCEFLLYICLFIARGNSGEVVGRDFGCCTNGMIGWLEYTLNGWMDGLDKDRCIKGTYLNIIISSNCRRFTYFITLKIKYNM